MIDIGIDLAKFILSEDDFYTGSKLHGIGHTYRVMSHCLVLGNMLGDVGNTRRAFCSAYIHDLSRRHDGYCTEHGLYAVNEKFPTFVPFFRSIGLDETDLDAIRLAVMSHSEREELASGHIHYLPVAILKDCDALDRIRLGEENLDPAYLRFEQSVSMIGYANELYHVTRDMDFNNFSGMWDIARNLFNRYLPENT